MNFNNFEHPQNSLTTEQRMEVIKTPNEILQQLNVSAPDYKKAVEELKMGNKRDLDYLKEMQVNLVAWSRILREKFKKDDKVDMYEEEILRQVNERLYNLSEEFLKIKP